MNKVMLMGRLTRDPEIRYSQGESPVAIGRFTLAVDRKYKKDGEANADFVNCLSFGKTAEFAEKYFHKGIKIAITGRIQTGSYTNRDGQKVYTTDVVVEEQEFAESKAASQRNEDNSGYGSGARYDSRERNEKKQRTKSMVDEDGFMSIPDGIDEELPFN
ncbi:MAG: single-stranded DNA-binding protein [Clostridiales bacterium]|nr:single-stranded DNA-binding protein [Clostridiales bacterium]